MLQDTCAFSAGIHMTRPTIRPRPRHRFGYMGYFRPRALVEVNISDKILFHYNMNYLPLFYILYKHEWIHLCYGTLVVLHRAQLPFSISQSSTKVPTLTTAIQLG